MRRRDLVTAVVAFAAHGVGVAGAANAEEMSTAERSPLEQGPDGWSLSRDALRIDTRAAPRGSKSQSRQNARYAGWKVTATVARSRWPEQARRLLEEGDEAKPAAADITGCSSRSVHSFHGGTCMSGTTRRCIHDIPTDLIEFRVRD